MSRRATSVAVEERAVATPGWSFGPEVLADPDRAERLEWYETNGLGGWAASSVSGTHSRRYHGLLVAATTPPTGRRVLLSRLDETLETAEGPIELAASRFPGAVHPDGHRRLERFRLATFPEFEYRAGGLRLLKSVAAIDGENTTVVVYEVLEADRPFVLALRPFFAGRDYHALVRANDAVARDAVFADHVLSYRPYPDDPLVSIAAPGASWTADPDWWRDFEYTFERERGLDFREDLFTPGVLRVRLGAGSRLAVVVTAGAPARRDGLELLEAERRRRHDRATPFAHAHPLCRALARAADGFVVRRGETLRTIVAGYPWFTDWGRDTMIALPGLCLVTGGLDDARRILAAFARATERGLLPNRFPDHGETVEYNTADASLWFFVAVRAYLAAGGDAEFVAGELAPVLREIVAWHVRGTHHGIRQDDDGLLRAGEPGVQLTWMDAKVGDWVVTPRHGKPVEINALWYNALRILADLEHRFGGQGQAAALRKRAAAVKRSFVARFWSEDAGYLFDVVDDGQADARLRPNQIFALSLPYPLLDRRRARSVLRAVEQRLTTPLGLRSLDPGDPDYCGRYQGDVPARDGAYHQGTVWAWLLGPYVTALVRVRGERGKREARRLLESFSTHLGEAGLGSVSEIFDGDEPHRPRGCPLQAWSVAEILRAAVEDAGLDWSTP